MNLTEYKAFCADIRRFCKEVRESAANGGAKLLERAAALEAALLEEYKQGGQNLAKECRALKSARSRAGGLIEEYRRRLAVYGDIVALVDDLERGAVSCPESVRGWLIVALNGLFTQCSELSGTCFEEFGKTEQDGTQGKTVPEKIRSTPYALELARKAKLAGYLDTEYLYIMRGYEDEEQRRGLIGQALGKACGHGWIKRIEKYWGLEPNQISKDAYNAKITLNEVLAI